MGTHTPGEWEVCGTSVFVLNNQRVQSNRLRITQDPGWTDEAGVRPSQKELEANARLIACAPELLEACIEAISLFDEYPELHEMKGTFEVLTNAIAKAEGRA